MIHGNPTSTPLFAPHLEAGALSAAPVTAPRPVSARAVTLAAAAEAETGLPILRLLIAVAMFFAFGALAPMISAAVR